MKQAMILGVKCNVVFGKYASDQIAIRLICAENTELEGNLGAAFAGEAMGTATVALLEAKQSENEVFLKCYGEQRDCGFLAALIEADVVKPPHRHLDALMQRPVAGPQSTSCYVAVCMLTDSALDVLNRSRQAEAA